MGMNSIPGSMKTMTERMKPESDNNKNSEDDNKGFAVSVLPSIGDLFLQKMLETNGWELPINIRNVSPRILNHPESLLVKVPGVPDMPPDIFDAQRVKEINVNDYVITTPLGVYSLEKAKDYFYVSYKGIVIHGSYLLERMTKL